MERLAQLSQRTLRLEGEQAYQVLAKAKLLESQGKHIIHFEIGQPDFTTPPNVARAGVHAIREGHTRYGPTLGIPRLRQDIAGDLNKRYETNAMPENIAVTPSGHTAIYAAMMAVLDPQDEVIYPSPSFPMYGILTDYFGAVRKPIPLLEQNSFSFNMDKLEESLSDRTKLIILCSPSNPTGGVIPEEDLKKIAQISKERGIWVMTDEIYAKLVYDREYPSYYKIGPRDNTILVDGFAKSYAMTGWRIGYMAAPTRIMDRIDNLLTHMTGGTAPFTQHAAIEALERGNWTTEKMKHDYKIRRDYIVDALNSIEGVSCVKPEGAFYVFPNITGTGKSSQELADKLLENGVALLPGTAFGKEGEGYLRLSYATSMVDIEKGLDIIKRVIYGTT